MACESCDAFRNQGHSFCGVCGDKVDVVSSGTPKDTSYAAEDAVTDEKLKEWLEQGWEIQKSRPCRRCGNPQLCSRVETREQQKGHNAGTTLTCNPILFVGFLLIDSIAKLCYPPRIVTTSVDLTICPRCKDERYENSRVVSERPVEEQKKRTKQLHDLPLVDGSVSVRFKQWRQSFSILNVLLMLLMTFLLGYIWWCYSYGGSNSSPNSTIQSQASSDSQSPGTSDNQEATGINATVTNEIAGDDYICKVTNNNNYAWNNVSFKFNEILTEGNWGGHTETIGPGETLTIKASEVNMHAPFVEVRIRCDTPQGPATWDGNISPEDLRR